jgi:hypothetical protein
MSSRPKRTHRLVKAVVLVSAVVSACAAPERTTASRASSPANLTPQFDADNPNSAAGDAQGIIHGWLDGQTVDLRYTRLYFCAQPPTSDVSTGCEIGAPATIAPRSGPIPKVYAIAPVGFSPDPATVHCPGGTVCLNHPPVLDPSRVNGNPSVFAPAHSHIISDLQSGWHETVNVRVTNINVWNDLAAAKSLSRLRELQALGQVGPDIPTNVYFFFEVQAPNPQP